MINEQTHLISNMFDYKWFWDVFNIRLGIGRFSIERSPTKNWAIHLLFSRRCRQIHLVCCSHCWLFLFFLATVSWGFISFFNCRLKQSSKTYLFISQTSCLVHSLFCRIFRTATVFAAYFGHMMLYLCVSVCTNLQWIRQCCFFFIEMELRKPQANSDTSESE